jgi:hypothetical protein
VNGGTHGLADFANAFSQGQGLIPGEVNVLVT